MKRYDSFELKALAGKPIDQCTVIDAHAHIGPDAACSLHDSSLEGAIAAMDRIGVDVICTSTHLVLSNYAREGNDMAIEAVRRYPERIFGYMTADIRNTETILPELERCLAAGMRAVKIHSSSAPYSHPNYDVLYKFADSNRLPILAHTAGREIGELENKFNKYRNINFMLAHAGTIEKDEYARVAEKYHNVYLETCVSQCWRGLIEYFVSRGLSEKVLWGTDITFISAEHQLGRVVFADISEQDKARILGGNAQKILNIRTRRETNESAGEKTQGARTMA